MKPSARRDFLVSHVVDKMTEYLVLDNNISIEDALKTVYQSNVYEQLQDEEGGLYAQSPSYVYELLKIELK